MKSLGRPLLTSDPVPSAYKNGTEVKHGNTKTEEKSNARYANDAPAEV